MEQSLLPYCSCNLIAINLNNCLTNNEFDFKKLKHYTRLCTRFTDNVIDLSMYPTDDYRQAALQTRNIGIGMMGLADVLIKLNIPYDSLEGINLAGKIMRNITKESIIMSSELAVEKGVFPLYKQYKDNTLNFAKKFFNMNNQEEIDEFKKVSLNGLRNSNWTTIQPTGSISISADCSASTEPLFAICYEKHISDSNDIWYFVNPEFEKRYKNQSWYKDALKQISKEKGSCQNLPYLSDKEKAVFKTAHDIKWQDRLKMQEALQKGCSNSLSVTINLPKETTKETISQIYMEAWEKRLKGLTVFVDGCLSEQPITFGKSDSKEITPSNECFIPEMYKKDLLDLERSERHRVHWKGSKLYINISLDDEDNPIEMFTKLPREAGINGNGDFNAVVYLERQSNWDLISRLISLSLRYSIPLNDIILQCDKSKVSMVDAAGILSRVLKAYQKSELEDIDDIDEYVESYGVECPECHKKSLIFEGGCKICYNCNYSACS